MDAETRKAEVVFRDVWAQALSQKAEESQVSTNPNVDLTESRPEPEPQPPATPERILEPEPEPRPAPKPEPAPKPQPPKVDATPKPAPPQPQPAFPAAAPTVKYDTTRVIPLTEEEVEEYLNMIDLGMVTGSFFEKRTRAQNEVFVRQADPEVVREQLNDSFWDDDDEARIRTEQRKIAPLKKKTTKKS